MRSNMKEVGDKYGKWMFFAAWVVLLGLLTLYFSGMLEKKYNPNQSPISIINGQFAEVVLLRNRMGHYVTSGKINNTPVTFLLDTGATNVVIPAHLGNQLNLTPGRRSQAQTANGIVTVADTNISELEISDIRLVNVSASLNPGMQGNEILLGMSVLKYLELTQRGDALILRAEMP